MAVLEQLQRLSDTEFLALYESLTERGFGPLDAEVAKALKFRPQAIRKLPLAKRAEQARKILLRNANAELCYELFGTYLMRGRKELVTGFLDATGVPHEEGMIEDLDKTPDPEKLGPALAELDGQFEKADVTIYLAMCVEQWPQVPALESLWRERG